MNGWPSPGPRQGRARPRVLFFAESVTLAHFGRMAALAGALDPAEFEATVACGPTYRRLLGRGSLRTVPLWSMPSAVFNERLARGEPLFPQEILQQYVADDLRLLAREAPDVVVSDFRPSLGISAELAAVPSIAVTNGCWSPYSTLSFPVPEHPLVRTLGLALATPLIKLIGPAVMATHRAASNRLRHALGLTRVTSLQELYTRATLTLYCDSPTLAPTRDLPPSHRYLGPVVWEPSTELPPWWTALPRGRPIVYLSAGSSGDTRLLPVVLEALADAPVTVMAATGGAEAPSALPANAFVAPYLPGIAAARRAALVISNGGSGTLYQALTNGVPVLGVPSNADQYLCMDRVVATGAGRLIRAGRLSPAAVRREVDTLLTPRFRAAAQAHRAELAAYDARARFAEALRELVKTGQGLPALPQWPARAQAAAG